ncbi:hypothetical protein BGZ79_000363 [Entomortierella chlamydospora]|nr:hypothetical protein BGZ79_000363 [Entomortierella chlamydospora]
MLLGDSGIDNDTVNRMWRGVATLINRSRSLSTIEIAAQRYPIVNEIWEAIQDSPKVKTLILNHVKINAEQSPNFWKACTVLEKLDLDACLFTIAPTPSHFPLLTDIRFGNLTGISPENQIHIMSLCPELKSIFWHGGMPISAIHRFTIGIVDRGEFKKLDSLDLTGLFIRDDDLRKVIKHMKQPIKRLVLVQTGFGPSSLTALELHFHVIQELNLVDCLEISSKNIARLLRSCPLLVSFKAGELSSLDVKEDESWPCSDRLLTLLVNIQLAEDDVQEASRRVFACLSKLTSLRLLNIAKYTSVMGSSQKSGRPLQLRLDCGLSLLSTLRYLELLIFDRSRQSMTMEEGIWIKTNWKRLVAIGGKFNDNNEQDIQIRNLFQDLNSRYDRRRLKA